MEARDTLYYHGVIYAAIDRPPVEAMLVRDGLIAAIGQREDVEQAAGTAVLRVDLDGRAVVPGFNDCHCHILGFGLNLTMVDVSPDRVSSVADAVRAVAARRAHTAEGDWIRGRGYDQNMLAERRHPTRHDLDVAAPDQPVVLQHTSGHVLTANSAALRLAGIGAGTPDPAGGVIERDAAGVPTGVLKESAMDLVSDRIPPPNPAEGTEAILAALEVMARFGITSATDAATGSGPSAEPELSMYRAAAASGRQRVRMGVAPEIAYVAPPESGQSFSPDQFDLGDTPEWLSLHGTKIFSDGAMSTRTAALREPYADDPGNTGILLWPHETLVSMMRRAHAAGWQIITHALGDGAVAEVVRSYGEALPGGSEGRRHRIEHAMLLDGVLAGRMRTLDLVPVIQPDIFRLGDGYITALGEERAAEVIPLRTFERAGLPIAFSSDAPVIPCDPLRVIRSAIERRTPSGVSLGRQHAGTLMAGIEWYTAGGAYATHREQQTGRLLPGMWADFAVLSRDPAGVAPEEMESLYVTQTVAGGRVTFEQ